MCSSFSIVLIISTLLLGSALNTQAQQPRNQKDPHIGYIYPAGGKQATLFEATAGGQFLEGVTGIRLSGGDDIQVSVVKYTRPLSQKEFNELRDKLMEARTKMAEQPGAAMNMNMDVMGKRELLATLAKEIGLSDETIAALVDYRKKLQDPKRQLNPQLAESVLLKVYIPPNAKLGRREIRLITPTGLSNPLGFYIGDLPEAQKADSDFKGVTPIEALPVTINGQLLPGRVDRYSFPARKGMRVVVRACVRTLIPYLADAVPGWFQAGVTLSDAQGRELAYAENFRYDPDPALTYEIPADGTYQLEVKDALYRGREDFIYRVTVGELPFVTGIFPLGMKEGEKTTVQLTGWNLPPNGVAVEKWGQTLGLQSVSAASNLWNSNSVPFMVDSLPEYLETEPNNDLASAQKLPLPIIVNGRIQTAGDWDVFYFDGNSGDQVVAEVQARRLNSPVDSVLAILDVNGKTLAVNDDFTNKGEGLSTHHADSLLNFTLPSAGRYYLRLGDTQRHGGPDFAYRLRVSLQQPDYALRVVPSCINVRAGAVVPITVYALRKDGFDGEITLGLKNGPTSAALDGARIPPGADQVRMTLTVPSTCTLGSYMLAVEGKALVKREEVRHIAVPADDMMQAFSYRHLVPSNEQVLTVVQSGRFAPPAKISQPLPLKLRTGTNRIRFTSLVGPLMLDQLKLELNDPPAGLSIDDIVKDPTGFMLVVRVDPSKSKEEIKGGNLLLDAYMDRPPQPGAQGKPAVGKQRIALGILPAVPYEIIK